MDKITPVTRRYIKANTNSLFDHSQCSSGIECCSKNAISFHYVIPEQMYVLHFAIYRLQPYGMKAYTPQPLPMKQSFVEAIDASAVSTNPNDVEQMVSVI